jgi:hypothetical protein
MRHPLFIVSYRGVIIVVSREFNVLNAAVRRIASSVRDDFEKEKRAFQGFDAAVAAPHRSPADNYKAIRKEHQSNISRSRLTERFIEPARILDVGLCVFAIGLLLALFSGNGGSLWFALCGWSFFGLGLSIIFSWPVWYRIALD